ncbi:MAG: hypothetical protein ACRDL5_00190, partial [Solirubrobacteraceae bacterium]
AWSTVMTDAHVRILRLLAKQRQRELDDHEAADRPGDAASTGRWRELERAAGRTRANVAAAEARRHYRRPARSR